MTIEYSDGAATESRILQILQAETRLGSEARIGSAHYEDWPTRYHLAPERSNLIRHLVFDGLNVLELGAGMGAVSRYLAERARTLTVVEGTRPRFAALSSRLRDLDNWSGTVGNIHDVRLEPNFDVVCLIGVLEYSELYLTSPLAAPGTPFSRTIETAARCLKPEGVLLVAIENKIGIKYWSGAPEDHSTMLFDGICGYPAGRSAKTFSRRELLSLLHGAGFGVVDEYYPFPDYKVPCCVLTDRLIELVPNVATGLATNAPYESYDTERANFFPDVLAVETVVRAGLLREFANSFLFLASRRMDSPVRRQLLRAQLEEREIAWHYSSFTRKVPTRTAFIEGRGPDGPVEVRKTTLLPSHREDQYAFGEGAFCVVWRGCDRRPTSRGDELRLILARHAYFREWQEFGGTLRSFLRWSIERWSTPGHDGVMNGEAVDAILLNATMLPGQGFSLFDSEWIFKDALPKSWFVFRNTVALWQDRHVLSCEPPFRSLRDLYEDSCLELGIMPDFTGDVEREAQLQALVADEDMSALRVGLTRLMTDPLNWPLFPRSPTAAREVRLAGARRSASRRLAKTAKRCIRTLPPVYRFLSRLRSWGSARLP